ncbi:MAG: hypothetical protein AB2598_01660 [Candidatus Thiodiazotropha sp.]
MIAATISIHLLENAALHVAVVCNRCPTWGSIHRMDNIRMYHLFCIAMLSEALKPLFTVLSKRFQGGWFGKTIHRFHDAIVPAGIWNSVGGVGMGTINGFADIHREYTAVTIGWNGIKCFKMGRYLECACTEIGHNIARHSSRIARSTVEFRHWMYLHNLIGIDWGQALGQSDKALINMVL